MTTPETTVTREDVDLVLDRVREAFLRTMEKRGNNVFATPREAVGNLLLQITPFTDSIRSGQPNEIIRDNAELVFTSILTLLTNRRFFAEDFDTVFGELVKEGGRATMTGATVGVGGAAPKLTPIKK